MNTYLIIILATIGAVALWLIYTFNRFVVLRTRSKEALSDIDVQTKRRYDLIPNLVDAVKGYMQHERSVLENVTKARTEAMAGAGSPLERAEKENALSNTLKTLFAVSENYPQLKANANFLDLQRELADTENKIQAARRFYNGNVRDLNIKIETFPARLVAGAFGFSKISFFETASEAEKEPVSVKF
ncbi:LemA family protein [Patescibacteria group bacterium]|nr:LemA family protein [Patescibacteria group bacterium]